MINISLKLGRGAELSIPDLPNLYADRTVAVDRIIWSETVSLYRLNCIASCQLN